MKKLEKRVSAVLVAAGSSTRMGFDKLSFDLGGETVLHRSIRAFEQDPLVTEIVLLAGQTLFMILYVVLVVFNIMGRDYDAAVIVSGTCGFGMGATPNAMANMQAICDKYSPSVKAYLLIPLVGSLFADFLNIA